MAVKTSRIPVMLLAAALAAGGLYAVATKTRSDDQRQVEFYAHWRPTYVAAPIIKMGVQGNMMDWQGQKPTFKKTLWMRKGEIAVLSVLLSPTEDITDARCSIKVGAESPKWGTLEGRFCYVQKYVS